MKQKVTEKSQRRRKRYPSDASDGGINQHVCTSDVCEVKRQACKKIRRKYAEMRELWRMEVLYKRELCELREMQQQYHDLCKDYQEVCEERDNLRRRYEQHQALRILTSYHQGIG